MAVGVQLVDLVLGGSLDTKTDDQSVKFLTFRELVNLHSPNPGALSPRPGLVEHPLITADTRYPVTEGFSGGYMSESGDGSTILQYGPYLYQYSSADAKSRGAGRHYPGEFECSPSGIGNAGGDAVAVDTGWFGIYLGSFSTQNVRIWYKDAASGEKRIATPTSSLAALRMVSTGTNAYLIQGSARITEMNAAIESLQGAVHDITVTGTLIDACADSTYIYLLSYNGTTAYVTRVSTSSWTTSTVTFTITSTAITSSSMFVNSDASRLVVYAANTANRYLVTINATAFTLLYNQAYSETAVSGVIVEMGNILYAAISLSYTSCLVYRIPHATGVPVQITSHPTGYRFVSRAWMVDGVPHVIAQGLADATYGHTYILSMYLNSSSDNIMAQFSPAAIISTGSSLLMTQNFRQSMVGVVVERIMTVYPEVDEVTGIQYTANVLGETVTREVPLIAYSVKNIDFMSDLSVSPRLSYFGAYLTSGHTLYDPEMSPNAVVNPVSPQELGFDMIAVGSGSGSSVLMQMTVARKLRTSTGEIVREYTPIRYLRANRPNTITSSGFGFSYTLPSSLRSWATGDLVDPELEIYVTEPNGSVFYLYSTLTLTSSLTGTVYFVSPGITPLPVPVTGGRLADINGNTAWETPVPSLYSSCVFKGRLVGIPSNDRTSLWYAREPGKGLVTAGLDNSLSYAGAGVWRFTAVTALGDFIILFTERQMLRLSGDFPTIVGTGGSMGYPAVIHNDVGCVSAHAVITTPKGVVFQDIKGWYLMLSNHELSYIGEGPYSSRESAVRSLALVHDLPEIIVSYDNDTTYCLNYDTGQWSVWELPEQAKMVGPIHKMRGFTTNTNTWLEVDDSQTVDLGTDDIPTSFKTGWLDFGTIRGFQRLRRLSLLGEKLLPESEVTIEVMVDYKDDVVQTVVIDTADLQASPMQIDMHIAVQKCESMSFRVSTNNAGVKWTGGSLTIGSKGTVDKSRFRTQNGA